MCILGKRVSKAFLRSLKPCCVGFQRSHYRQFPWPLRQVPIHIQEALQAQGLVHLITPVSNLVMNSLEIQPIWRAAIRPLLPASMGWLKDNTELFHGTGRYWVQKVAKPATFFLLALSPVGPAVWRAMPLLTAPD